MPIRPLVEPFYTFFFNIVFNYMLSNKNLAQISSFYFNIPLFSPVADAGRRSLHYLPKNFLG